MVETTRRLRLGRTEVNISPMGIGTWSWGDRTFWGYGTTHFMQDIRGAFDVYLNAGLNFFDTASIYGFGQNERILGNLLKRTDQPLIVATKLFPFPWQITQESILRGIRGCIHRLGRKPIDLIQHHWPLPPKSVEGWMRVFAHAHEIGLIRAIGVSNYNLKNMQRAIIELGKWGLPLTSNQVHFSLLHRKPEFNGLLDFCKKEGITLLAYSPLGQGLLTGKYTPSSLPPKGMMRLGNPRFVQRIQPLLEIMRQIGKDHVDKTPAQVAINWVICKGAIPLVGAKNAVQAKENLGALGWQLTMDEISALDEASQEVQISFPMEQLVGLN